MLTGGEVIDFRHELARLALEDSLPSRRCVDLHRRALAALGAPPTGGLDLDRLAHHAEAAGDGDAALEYSTAAAERASSVGAHREAARHYERALRFADRAPVARRAELLERHSFESYLVEEHETAVGARRRALDCYRTLGDRPKEAEQLRWLARLLKIVGVHAEAEESAQRAVELLEELEPGRELAMAYATVAQLRMLTDDSDAAVAWGTKAMELAERLGDREPLVHALNTVGNVEACLGEPGRDRQARAESRPRARGRTRGTRRPCVYEPRGTGCRKRSRCRRSPRARGRDRIHERAQSRLLPPVHARAPRAPRA